MDITVDKTVDSRIILGGVATRVRRIFMMGDNAMGPRKRGTFVPLVRFSKRRLWHVNRDEIRGCDAQQKSASGPKFGGGSRKTAVAGELQAGSLCYGSEQVRHYERLQAGSLCYGGLR